MKADKPVQLLAVVGSLVLTNIIAVGLFGRLDLTRDGQYTLGQATTETLRRLHDPVTVKAYFSKDVPPQLASNARYVQDLLEEYYAAAGGLLSYEFVDPTEEETEADKEKKKEVKRDIFGRSVREKTSVETELEKLGIPAVEVRAREADKLELKKAYMGLAIKYGDKTEVIPVIQETSTLEYDLTTLLRKLTRDKTPKIAFVHPGGDFDPQKEMGRVYGLLTQMYDVTSLDAGAATEIAPDIDGIIVLGRGTFGDAAKRAIDAFVMSGKSAAFLVDSVKPDLSTLQVEPVDHGLREVLASYGVQVQDGLVLDPECATIQIQQQRGFMRIAQPVQYPFLPIAKKLDTSHPLTRGLSEIAFPFMSPLEVTVAEGGDVKATVLAKSSDGAWVQTAPYDLDPFKRWTKDDVGEQKQRGLLVALSGNLKSFYGAPAALVAPEPGAEGDAPAAATASARVLVAGGSAFMGDQFLAPPTQALALNLVDWLLQDEALLAMRTRGLAAAPLDETSEGTKATVKYANIVGLPLAFAGLGLVRWRRREARRAKVTL